MARSHAQILTAIRSVLFEATADEWSDAEITAHIPQGLRDISSIMPRHIDQKLGLDVEARSGSATSTSAGNLVDATKAHFLSTDVGKVIYNTTDYTWAEIVTYTSTTTVALSKDIMASGEEYEIYNKDCRNQKQIYIGDYLNDIIIEATQKRVEYKPGYIHGFERISDTVIEIITDTDPDTDYTKGFINFARLHKLPNLTDWVGAVNNAGGYAAGSVSMAIDGLSGTETIPEGAEFTIASVRGIYTVTADVTLSGGGGTITFYPALDTAVINDQVITITKSTLTPKLETILADYVAGLCAVNLSREKIPDSTFGDEVAKLTNWGAIKMKQALAELGRTKGLPLPAKTYPR